jgi:hypothetical protein
MIRRGVLLLGLIALAGTIGCGLIQTERPWANALRPGAVTRNFDYWSTEVIMSAMEVTGVEFSMNEMGEHDFRIGVRSSAFGVPPGSRVVMNDPVEVDEKDLYLETGSFSGKTKDGRAVTVWVWGRDEGKKADLTILIGKTGDPELSRAYLDRVADRLAHPTARTPEETEKRKLKVPINKKKRSAGDSVELLTAEPKPDLP